MEKIVLEQTGAKIQEDLNLTESMFPFFSTSSTYEIGNIVRYQDKIYKCVEKIETAGAWDSTRWEETKINHEAPRVFDVGDDFWFDDLPSDLITKLKCGDVVKCGMYNGFVTAKDEGECSIVSKPYDEDYLYQYFYSFNGNEWELDDSLSKTNQYLPQASEVNEGDVLRFKGGGWCGGGKAPTIYEVADFSDMQADILEQLKCGDIVSSGGNAYFTAYKGSSFALFLYIPEDENRISRYTYTKRNNVWTYENTSFNVPCYWYVEDFEDDITGEMAKRILLGDIVSSYYADYVGYVCRHDQSDTLEVLRYDTENGCFIKYRYSWNNNDNVWEYTSTTEQKDKLYLHEVSDGDNTFIFVSSNPNPIFDIDFSYDKIVAVRHLEDLDEGKIAITFNSFQMLQSSSAITMRIFNEIYYSTSQETVSLASQHDCGFVKANLTENITEIEQ